MLLFLLFGARFQVETSQAGLYSNRSFSLGTKLWRQFVQKVKISVLQYFPQNVMKLLEILFPVILNLSKLLLLFFVHWFINHWTTATSAILHTGQRSWCVELYRAERSSTMWTRPQLVRNSARPSAEAEVALFFSASLCHCDTKGISTQCFNFRVGSRFSDKGGKYKYKIR